MNLREHFLELVDFLKPYQTIWQNEIMLLYPTPFDDYPAAWLEEIMRFKEREELIRIERKQFEEFITEPSLRAYYERRKELISVPLSKEAQAMPEGPFTFLFMIPKKQHEIRKLAPLLDQLYQSKNIQKPVDIGGGIGLLAQTLVNQYGHRVCSVDLDPVMQKTGLDRHRKNARNPENLVEYQNVKVELGDGAFSNLLDSSTMTVGLHTCGDLAVAQLEASAKRKARSIVNFGCCYHKIVNDSPVQNISNFAREHGKFHMTQFALTLASRAHLKLPEKDFDFKMKVKLFRYAIHFLLHDHYDIKKLVSLGNSNRQLYEGNFGVYALEQFQRIDLVPKHTAQELDVYFNSPEIQLVLMKMLSGGIIRDSFGRLLELYLQLDRAIYLEEQGYQVELLQCFDEIISPRNLGLFATLPD